MTNAFDWQAPRDKETKKRKEKPRADYGFQLPDFLTTVTNYPSDITGYKFGRLTALSRGDTIRGSYTWKCLCDCGNTKTVIAHNLKAGRTKSCGCMKEEVVEKRNSAIRLSIVDFIAIAKLVHHDKYDYTLVKCNSVKTKVDIICPVHGMFKQRVNNHLKGHGCKQCADDAMKSCHVGEGLVPDLLE